MYHIHYRTRSLPPFGFHPKNIWWRVQTMKILIIQFSLSSCYSISIYGVNTLLSIFLNSRWIYQTPWYGRLQFHFIWEVRRLNIGTKDVAVMVPFWTCTWEVPGLNLLCVTSYLDSFYFILSFFSASAGIAHSKHSRLNHHSWPFSTLLRRSSEAWRQVMTFTKN
jgi:hypothetical protein